VDLALTRDQTLTILNYGELFFLFVLPIWMVWRFNAWGVLLGGLGYWILGNYVYDVLDNWYPNAHDWGTTFHFGLGWIPPVVYGFILLGFKNVVKWGRKKLEKAPESELPSEPRARDSRQPYSAHKR
jgi:hypothetical protein